MKTNLQRIKSHGLSAMLIVDTYADPEARDEVDDLWIPLKDIESLEKELREKLLPAVLSAMAELYDDRLDFQKGWKMGYVTCLQQILGEDKMEES